METRPNDYLLYCRAQCTELDAGLWSFTLETFDGQTVIEASDQEPGDLNRLALWAALRGIEAVDGSASVTLLSNNRYLIRSLTDSLPRWRERNFVWEHFGRRVEVQNADLWRRVDRAIAFHDVETCLVQSQRIGRRMDQVESALDQITRVDDAHFDPQSRSGPEENFGSNPSSGNKRIRGQRPSSSRRRFSTVIPQDPFRKLLHASETLTDLSRSRRFSAADLS